MDTFTSGDSLLVLIDQPAFFMKDDRIIQVNDAALNRQINVGDPLSKFMHRIPQVYRDFQDGSLFMNLRVGDSLCPTCVTRQKTGDLFVVDIHTDKTSRALALAARQLRHSLNTVYAVLDDVPLKQRPPELNQALAQMHRQLCNMSDMMRFDTPQSARLTATNLTSVFTETMEKCQHLLEKTKHRLVFSATETVYGMADRDMIERALWNILSNSVKFSTQGGFLNATLSRSGNLLRISVHDTGDGIRSEILQQVYSRYLREPSIEDSRFGLGLGLAIVSTIAGLHGGTVLIDHPDGKGARVTMTLTIRPCPDHLLRSPVTPMMADYCGGFDHGLLELSDVLPAEMYK